MSHLRNYFLGPFRVTRDDKSVLGFESDKMRALLAYLIVEAHHPHHRDALAALLWPDQADTAARQSLRQALYVVRHAIDTGRGSGVGDQESASGLNSPPPPADAHTPDPRSPLLLVTRQTVQFNPASDTWCDVWLFNSLLAASEAHDHRHLRNPDRCVECVERLQQATELYRAEFLQGFLVNDSREFEEWALLERETHHRQMMHALGRLAGYYQEVGEHEQALRFVMWQLKLEPWQEESHRQAMSLLSRTGQRSAALAQYETCRRVLEEELGVTPARETTALYERIRDAVVSGQWSVVSGQNPPATTGSRSARGPLTTDHFFPIASTPLIGREAEVTAVVEQLLRDDVRLLTLTGPGGVGKTRIAMQAAADLQEHFEDGAYFVNLAPITDPSLLAVEIARALGVKEMPDKTVMESLVSYLQGKQVLLLLDNFEQIADAAPLITRLIQAQAASASASGLKVLVTSRVALGLRGTHEFVVAPMSLPDRMRLPALERLAGYEAIRLFAARAAALKPGFEVTADNAQAIVEICHRLDGLPLAIELAAARIKVLPPRAMLARMQSRLELIAGRDRDVPTRQQTLRNTIEWSYDLLDEGERQLFRRMAVFQGGRRLEGLETVCNYDGQLLVDVLEGVESLVSKSLLQQREGWDGEPRFWMLETIHEYAREKLQESGEAEALEREHAHYFMKLAEEAEPEVRGAQQAEWLARLEDEHDNIRAALRWAGETSDTGQIEEGDGAADAALMGLRIAGALWRFWDMRGYLSEGRAQLAGMLRIQSVGKYRGETEEAREVKRARGKALSGAGVLAWIQGDYTSARTLHEESLAIRRELGDKWDIAQALNNLGNVAIDQGDYASARSMYEESLATFRELGDKRGCASMLNNLGLVAYAQGDYASARSMYEECLAIFRDLGSRMGISASLYNLGNMAYMQGDYASARSSYEESLAIRRELGIKGGIAEALSGLGHVARRQGDVAGATKLYIESLSISRETGAKLLIANSLIGLGAVACAAGQPARGARLLGAVEALIEAMGAVQDSVDQAEYEQGVAATRAQLDEEAFGKAWAEGRAMSMDQAIEYALGLRQMP